MRRLIILLLVLTVLAIGAAAIADLGGTVRILVAGWQFDFSLSLLMFIALALMLAAVIAVELTRVVMATPARWRAQKALERQARGVELLDQGYTALFAGDGDIAFKRGRRARQLLDDAPSAMLLTLKGAEASGDTKQVAKMARSLEKDANLGAIAATAREGQSKPVEKAVPVQATPAVPVAVNDAASAEEKAQEERALEEKAMASRQTP